MAEKSAYNYIPKGIATVDDHVHKHPSMERCEWTTSASLITVRRAIKETLSIGSARVVAVVGTPIKKGSRYSISTDTMEVEKDTPETGAGGRQFRKEQRGGA